ncbi:ATP-binding protein [Planosporangium thailandense]|uniref:ATP-binding protein n=1 Tax=Planosporangium thailandense TaxID=765197 RepID=A0ABX0XVX1_9ACTN|nr:ATP-binding protein [Planosporangium thailandense]NJC70042.1 ATP-binding protein [Planosporangium thailandense]
MPGRRFDQSRSAVPAARRYIVEALSAMPFDLVSTAGLLVSELASNAVLHGGGAFDVSVEYVPDKGLVRIEVTDSGDGQPTVQAPSVTAEHGRGLLLVDKLANAWGVQRGSTRKTVWFELVSPPA